jgi:hypothetical protein
MDDVEVGQVVLVFDSQLWGGRDKGDNSQLWKPATVEKVYWLDGDHVVDVRFHHDNRQSSAHFVWGLKQVKENT